MSNIHGRPLWYELLTTDRDAASVFYTEVVGWKTQLWDGAPESGYTMWVNSQGQSIGGLSDLPEQARQMGAPPHWLAYVGVDDVDATAARFAELGGKIYVPAFDVEKVGRIAIVADPQGAVIGLYAPAGDMPPKSAEPAFGDISWHELMTTDYEAALAFYGQVFGWRGTQAMEMGPA